MSERPFSVKYFLDPEDDIFHIAIIYKPGEGRNYGIKFQLEDENELLLIRSHMATIGDEFILKNPIFTEVNHEPSGRDTPLDRQSQLALEVE